MCSTGDCYQCFRGTWYHHLQGRSDNTWDGGGLYRESGGLGPVRIKEQGGEVKPCLGQ